MTNAALPMSKAAAAAAALKPREFAARPPASQGQGRGGGGAPAKYADIGPYAGRAVGAAAAAAGAAAGGGGGGGIGPSMPAGGAGGGGGRPKSMLERHQEEQKRQQKAKGKAAGGGESFCRVSPFNQPPGCALRERPQRGSVGPWVWPITPPQTLPWPGLLVAGHGNGVGCIMGHGTHGSCRKGGHKTAVGRQPSVPTTNGGGSSLPSPCPTRVDRNFHPRFRFQPFVRRRMHRGSGSTPGGRSIGRRTSAVRTAVCPPRALGRQERQRGGEPRRRQLLFWWRAWTRHAREKKGRGCCKSLGGGADSDFCPTKSRGEAPNSIPSHPIPAPCQALCPSPSRGQSSSGSRAASRTASSGTRG